MKTLIPVTKKLLDKMTKKAKKSPRKRAHYLFHKHDDPVHRIINAIEPGTYIPPHKHQDPKKIEAFVLLRGKAACVGFNDKGKITEVHVLEKEGPKFAVDITPGAWHTFISLKSGTALFEVVQGPYEKLSHKNLAPWAPSEENGKSYIKKLEKEVKSRIKVQK